MPITPRFDLSQTDSHIILKIHVPHVRVSPESVQVVLTDNNTTLHFASPPTYLLVLNFGESHHFHETADECCARYEPMIENGIIVLELQKETPGVVWENLDLLGRLAPAAMVVQQRQNGAGIRWLQSIKEDQPQKQRQLGHRGGEGMIVNATDGGGEAVPPPTTQVEEFSGYGFLRLFHGIYSDLVRDGLAKEMLEFPWIETENDHLTTAKDTRSSKNAQLRKDRRRKRREMEQEKFSAERYLGDIDLEDDYIYQCAMAMKPQWEQTSLQMNQDDLLSERLSSLTIQEQKTDSCIIQSASFFSQEEGTTLLSIPYPLLPPMITPEQEHGLLMGLLDIVYAYTYDHLSTDGEPTVESAWTISILSASLSCLDDWLDDDSDNNHDDETRQSTVLKNVICSSLRRALIYPYLRNWNFGIHVWKHVILMLQKGIRRVLRSLLQTRSILDKSELYYMGNKLFIDPYLAWLQAHPDNIEQKLKVVAGGLGQILQLETLKDDLQLDLLKLEVADSESDNEESSSNESNSESSNETASGDDDSSSSSSESESKVGQAKLATSIDGQTMTGDDFSSKVIDKSSSLLDENLGPSIEKISLSVPSEKKEGNRRSLIQEMD